MLPSSTRTSLSGPRPSTPCPTVLPRTSMNSGCAFTVQSIGSGGPRNCSGPASLLLSCRGNAENVPLLI
jgi:hypothetical protein